MKKTTFKLCPNGANPTTGAKLPEVLVPSLENADAHEPGDARVFFRIAGASTSLGLGVLLASAQAVKIDSAGISFGLSCGTLIAFGVGAFFGYLPWKLAAAGPSARGLKSGLFRASTALILLCGVGAFLYPLRFVPPEKLPEVLKGLAVAAVVLSVLGFILWRLFGFLAEDSEQAGQAAK